MEKLNWKDKLDHKFSKRDYTVDDSCLHLFFETLFSHGFCSFEKRKKGNTQKQMTKISDVSVIWVISLFRRGKRAYFSLYIRSLYLFISKILHIKNFIWNQWVITEINVRPFSPKTRFSNTDFTQFSKFWKFKKGASLYKKFHGIINILCPLIDLSTFRKKKFHN